MKLFLPIFILICIVLGCQTKQKATSDSNAGSNLQISGAFLDAFYSFDEDSLKSVLSSAPKSHPSILYYQKWAECGHYKVMERFPCAEKNDTLITCPVMVKDDLMSALQLDLNVTDTFHLTIKEGLIRSITTSSNDPAIYYEGKAWIEENRPELIKEPCKDAWNGGPTPCECIQGTVEGLKEFAKREL